MKAYLVLGFFFSALAMNASAQRLWPIAHSIIVFEGDPEYLSTQLVWEKTSSGNQIEILKIERCAPLSMQKGKASCQLIAKQPALLMRNGLECLAKKYEQEKSAAEQALEQNQQSNRKLRDPVLYGILGSFGYNVGLLSATVGTTSSAVAASSAVSLPVSFVVGGLIAENRVCSSRVEAAKNQYKEVIDAKQCAKELAMAGASWFGKHETTLAKTQPALIDAFDQIRNYAVEASRNPHGGIQQACFSYDQGRQYLTYASTNGASAPKVTRKLEAEDGVYMMTTIKKAPAASTGKAGRRVAPPAVVAPKATQTK
jgi:hypothetical protein